MIGGALDINGDPRWDAVRLVAALFFRTEMGQPLQPTKEGASLLYVGSGDSGKLPRESQDIPADTACRHELRDAAGDGLLLLIYIRSILPPYPCMCFHRSMPLAAGCHSYTGRHR